MTRRAGLLSGLADRSGAAAVEFALVLVPFLVILFGIIQVTYTFGLLATLNEAATETARTLQLEFPESAPTVADAEREARARFKGPDPSRLFIVLETVSGGQLLRLSYDVPLFFPIIEWNVTRVQANAMVLP